MRRIADYAAVALAATIPLAACDGDSGLDAGAGSVSVLMTDAAGDFQAAVVTISKIYLQGDGGEVVLLEDDTTFDLLTLANDVAALVEEATVPAGSYGQLRFVIDGGYIEVENGDGTTSVFATAGYPHTPAGVEVDGELVCPSCAQSGLKVNLGGVQIEGDGTILLLDFDVAQSFGHETGSGTWVMHPVIKTSELQLSASVLATLALADSVSLPQVAGAQVTLGNFKAKLTNGDGSAEELPLADADSNSIYEAEFKFLIPGSYTLEFVGPAGLNFTLDTANPSTVDAGSGERAEVNAVVTSASASGT